MSRTQEELRNSNFNAHVMPIYEATGQVSDVSANTCDHTGITALKERLEVALLKAKKVKPAKNDSPADMRHEIRMLLSYILELSDLALRSDISEKSRIYLINILQSATWLHFANEVQQMSKTSVSDTMDAVEATPNHSSTHNLKDAAEIIGKNVSDTVAANDEIYGSANFYSDVVRMTLDFLDNEMDVSRRTAAVVSD